MVNGTQHSAGEPAPLSLSDFDLVLTGWVMVDMREARVFADTLAAAQDDAAELFKAKHTRELIQHQDHARFQLVAAIGMTPKAPPP